MWFSLSIVLEVGEGKEEKSEVQSKEEREERHRRFQGAEQKNGGEDKPALQN